MDSNGSAVIEVADVPMRYGKTDVLDGVTLHVDRGEVVVLPTDVLLLAAALALGLGACLPIGFAVGSVVRRPRAVGGWGMLVMAGLVFVSGVFVPASQLPGWAQVLGQLTPMYWMGHLMRQAILPEGVVVIEIGENWRTAEALGVLGLWVLVGVLLASVLLRRMARRESGSVVAAGREKQLQRV